MRSRIICNFVFVFLSALTLCAQTPPKTPNLITQFNFAPPGARSLAMGATFIGVADDATASESNPAGLVILSRPEVSAHVRLSSFFNTFPNTVSGIGSDRFKDDSTGLSFLSYVHPFGRIAVSGYYQQAANFKSHSQFSGTFTGFEDFDNADSASSTFRLDNLGFSTALRIRSNVFAGATIRRSSLNLDYGTFSVFTICTFDEATGQCPIDQSIRVERTIDDGGSKMTFNAGMLLDFNPVSIGVVYKQGADFEFGARNVFQEKTETANVDQENVSTESVKVPATYGVGFSYRPRDVWRLSMDIVRISYSDLSTNVSDPSTGETRFLKVDDGTDIHFGGEYTMFVKETPMSLRAGYYHEPDHDLFPDIDSSASHVTFGGGIRIKNLQIDMAVNLSHITKEALFSFVQRF